MSFDYGYAKKESADPDYVAEIKLLVVGECSVGKTNIISRYFSENFNFKTPSTYTPSYLAKFINIKNKVYRVNIWDTAGQERFHSLTKIFLKNANIAILVYAINDIESFNSLSYWYNSVNECSENVLFCVAGNKSDLFEEETVTQEMGKKYADSIGAFFYITSAKDLNNGNIHIMFEEIIKSYVDKNELQLQEEGLKRVQSLIEHNRRNSTLKKKGCCK